MAAVDLRQMNDFEDIRPYHDDEVPEVLGRLLANREFIRLIARFRAPRLARFLPPLVDARVRRLLTRETRDISSIADFQRLVSQYVDALLRGSTTGFTYDGIEGLRRDQGYVFVGNHRDIAADSMLLDYALFYSGFETVRIAIGDNLLQRDFATDLMRLNKSFVIKRSAEGPKKVYAALLQSSSYIAASTGEGHSVWIAQAEGRAKDGLDRTDPAVIKMLTLAHRKHKGSYAELIGAMNLVPVAIAYEYDPCDQLKAKELYLTALQGGYVKPQGEDLLSLVRGLTGFKGRVRLVVGAALAGDFTTPEAVASALDRQVLQAYQLFPSNFVALELLEESPYRELRERCRGLPQAAVTDQERQFFMARLQTCPKEWQPFLLRMYANPILNLAEFVPERLFAPARDRAR